jgi:hypothetical protein
MFLFIYLIYILIKLIRSRTILQAPLRGDSHELEFQGGSEHTRANEASGGGSPSNDLTSGSRKPSLEAVLWNTANPTSGGVTASTEMLAAKRHAGVHTPVIVGKMIIANQQMAYAA